MRSHELTWAPFGHLDETPLPLQTRCDASQDDRAGAKRKTTRLDLPVFDLTNDARRGFVFELHYVVY